MTDQSGYVPPPKSFATLAIHHAQKPSQWDSKALTVPIVTSSTFEQPMYESNDNKKEKKRICLKSSAYKTYKYGRWGNPTRHVLEQVLAKLDNGKYGLAFSSGLAASTAALSLLKAGDHMISSYDIYGGTSYLFNQVATQFGIEVTWVDLNDLSNVEKQIKSNTKLLWMETPTNPTMQVFDIKAIAQITKKNNLILVVDNTFLTSYFLRPLEFGVDIVCYSLTKYMNGHTDVIMGALVMSDRGYYDKLKNLQVLMGNVPSPFDCYLVNRGIKTLALRMQQHSKNSLYVAKYLEKHPKVEKVLHPGLPSHPKHELFKSQTGGHSGTFSFYIKGDIETAKKFVSSLELIINAGSLGGIDSLIEFPCLISHRDVPQEEKDKLGITDNFLRLSIGIEDAEDLVADLEQAFDAI